MGATARPTIHGDIMDIMWPHDSEGGVWSTSWTFPYRHGIGALASDPRCPLTQLESSGYTPRDAYTPSICSKEQGRRPHGDNRTVRVDPRRLVLEPITKGPPFVTHLRLMSGGWHVDLGSKFMEGYLFAKCLCQAIRHVEHAKD